MILDAARRRDNREGIPTGTPRCKLFASGMCGRAAQAHGGAGYVSEYAIDRICRAARLFRIYECTTRIQQLVAARNLIRGAQV